MHTVVAWLPQRWLRQRWHPPSIPAHRPTVDASQASGKHTKTKDKTKDKTQRNDATRCQMRISSCGAGMNGLLTMFSRFRLSLFALFSSSSGPGCSSAMSAASSLPSHGSCSATLRHCSSHKGGSSCLVMQLCVSVQGAASSVQGAAASSASLLAGPGNVSHVVGMVRLLSGLCPKSAAHNRRQPGTAQSVCRAQQWGCMQLTAGKLLVALFWR